MGKEQPTPPRQKSNTGPQLNQPVSRFTEYDIYLFKEGNHNHLYDKFGAHPMVVDGVEGVYFSVWAPNAEKVYIIGNFNGWNPQSHSLNVRKDGSGIWEGFIGSIEPGEVYKYHIVSNQHGYQVDKGDPYGFEWEEPPKTGSVVCDIEYHWKDHPWMSCRQNVNKLSAPMSIYEVHLGSWRRIPEEGNRYLTYREMAPLLAEYVKHMGFTHVEFLPLTEHPFYGSWGYQTVGYFAPTRRYGTPQDFMYLVDFLHQNGIGVILDWVPSHFPSDEHGLVYFDGTHLFEHADPRKGFHLDWKSYIFNYGRNEVKAFLISSALFWLEKYHLDGLRVDAVASMLYLDYGRQGVDWVPNEYGGRENIEAVGFLRKMNEAIYEKFPDVQTFAEESTAWPMVSRPTYVGGLGFGMKWNMGWMHDTLEYFSKDSVFRKYHHNQLTFSICYAFSENFVLPLSHDEVVHGKGSLLGKLPGDKWQRFANLRLLYGYLYAHPGKKLLMMGGEFGQWNEWYHEASLDWHLLEYPSHQGIQKWVRDLNHLYKGEAALHEIDFQAEGFEWVDCQDWENSIISFLRKGKTPNDRILVVCNFTPVPRNNYRMGVPMGGYWKETLNSDAKPYWGSGQENFGGLEATPIPSHGHGYSLSLVLPPLSICFFKYEADVFSK